MRIASAFIVALCLAAPAVAQNAPRQDEPPGAAAAPPGMPAPAAQPGMRPAPGATGRRLACRDEARQKGLRGPAAHDTIQMCLLHAREGCLKEAIARNIGGSARRDFIKSCMG